MAIQHYSFAALESLLFFLKTAYSNLNISIEGKDKEKYIICGCIEIRHDYKGYEVIVFYLGCTRCNLGIMSVEQIATLLYILIENRESFVIKGVL